MYVCMYVCIMYLFFVIFLYLCVLVCGSRISFSTYHSAHNDFATIKWLESTQRVQTSTRRPSWICSKSYFMPELLLLVQYLSECQVWWKYVKQRPSYYDFEYDGFDLELWQATSVKWNFAHAHAKTSQYICVKFHEHRTFTFGEITLSATNERTNEPTNQSTNKLAWSQYLVPEVKN